MNTRILEWDTNFFGFPVALALVDESSTSEDLKKCLKYFDQNVTYVIIPKHLAVGFCSTLKSLNGICYDEKVTFMKNLIMNGNVPENIIHQTNAIDEVMLELAYLSGHMSRFRRDPRFEKYFHLLYREWLSKACSGEQNAVFLSKNGSVITGLATVEVQGCKGNIGLLAVEPASRGSGYGASLISACEHYLHERGVTECRIVTQNNNLAACSLYRKAGYMLESQMEVWHVWK